MSRASAGLSSAHSRSPTPNPLMTATTFTKRHDVRPHPEITAFSSVKLVASAQRQIDQEIRKYQESVRALQFRRNALSPVGRLPPEMLSRIFLFCSDPESLSWIKEVSHICHYWRTVALSCPNLWSFPVFSQPKWADEMLKRSKMAPLTIKADMTYMTPRMVNTVHSSLVQISRIGELDVKTGSRSVPEILNLTDTAPYLHSLSLASPGFSQAEHFTLPDKFLNGEAPRLRKLELTRFFLPWDSPLMANLVHLKIHNPGPTARPSMTEFVQALERMPLLETLELDNALPEIAAGVSTVSMASSRTALKHLKRLAIANVSALECADVLNHLSYPPTTSTRISCVGETSTVTAFSALIPALSDVPGQSAGNLKNLRSLYISIGFGGIVLRGWTCSVQSFDPPATRPFLDLDLRCHRFMRAESEELMAFACKSLPIRGLRALSLSTDMHEIGTKTWISTFADLPTLLTVRLRGEATSLIATLREDVFVKGVKQIPRTPAVKHVGRRGSLRNARKSVSGGLFFPALRNLVLEGADFSAPALDTFEDALMERCERKQELWTLKLYDCNRLTPDDVERLEHIVVEVDWDEVEQGFTDEESEGDDMSSIDVYYGVGGFDDADLDSDYGYW
ncbi:hypothetical protein DFH07DRAFT_810614 [Mycena maculata]|uniref:F-box domain-containing protein n=1 Tax=Mycena maculata TaxID=230809 RepID=A0AAD7JIY5_9AGAR|nr:hypothetical protein DFH07DRAFT_810614 [Mycena maculata]